MKHLDHDNITSDFEKAKRNHLIKLANKLLRDEEKTSKLKEKNISTNFFKLFKDDSANKSEGEK